jgi:hypothetical protein
MNGSNTKAPVFFGGYLEYNAIVRAYLCENIMGISMRWYG